MRYLICFSYDGTNFHGYQKQPGKRCVESEFERALFSINNHTDTKIVGAGRTDRGVHANYQCAHFDISVDISLYKLKCALNSLLPNDIHVFRTEIVDKDFHARFMAREKTYKYIINCGEYNPLERNYVYQYNRELDVNKMKEAIEYFKGVHDFQSFVSEDAIKESYVREIFDVDVSMVGDKIIFSFSGNGFMKYQVRNMVGTLVKVGKGKLEPIDIKKILEDINLRKYVTTIKPEGLYLDNIKY